jgi:hypothetical protein
MAAEPPAITATELRRAWWPVRPPLLTELYEEVRLLCFDEKFSKPPLVFAVIKGFKATCV